MKALPAAGLRHWLPLGFVIVLLFALVSIPVISERRIRGYEEQLNEVIEPARALVSDIQLAHGLAGGALRDYLLTGSAETRARYEDAAALEASALQELEPLVAELGTEVRQEFAALRSAVLRWRSDVAAALDTAELDPGFLAMSDHNEQALISGARLDRELAEIGTSLRQQVRREKQRDVELAAFFLILAVLAAAVVGWAGRRLHLTAVAAEQARADLVRVNESRARLIRGFSHDVKNPLGGADGYAQLLEEGILGELTEEQLRGVGRLRGALQAALRLIDDLVDLARAEAGQIDLHIERFDLADLVHELVEEYRAAAEAKGLAIEERPVPGVVIESDRIRTRQILSNLFSNAVKYTERGSITASARWAPARREPDPNRWAVAAVEDTGPGIPEEQQHLLFREFTRLDPTGSRGAGLGLAISQGLAHALGGQITLRSRPGRGSVFMLWLPDTRLPPIPSVRTAEAIAAPDR